MDELENLDNSSEEKEKGKDAENVDQLTFAEQEEIEEVRQENAEKIQDAQEEAAKETEQKLEEVRAFLLPSRPQSEKDRNLTALDKLSIGKIPSKEDLGQYSREQIISAAKTGLAGLWLDREAGGANVYRVEQLKEILSDDPNALQRTGEMAIAAAVAEGQAVYHLKNIIDEAKLDKTLDEVLQAPGMSSWVEQAAMTTAQQGDLSSAKIYFRNAPTINRQEFIDAYSNGLVLRFRQEIRNSVHIVKILLDDYTSGVPEEIKESSAYQDVIQMTVSDSLRYTENSKRITEIKEAFQIKEEDLDVMISRSIASQLDSLVERKILGRHKISEALKLAKNLERLNAKSDLLKSDDVQQAAQELIYSAIYYKPLKGLRSEDKPPLFSDIVEVQQAFNVKDRPLDFTYNLFGNFSNRELYFIAKEVYENGTLDLGITKDKEAGLEQLREKIFEFKQDILKPDFDAKVLQESDFHKGLYKALTRFAQSEWGSHDDEDFGEMVDAFIKVQNEGEIAPLPEDYQSSGEVRINKVNKEAQDNFQYSEQFLNRYDTLKSSLEDAMSLFGEKKPLSHMSSQIEAKRNGVIADLEVRLEALENPKAQENLKKRIENLKSLDLRSVKSFQDNFATLSQFKEFHKELRQSVFYYALAKRENAREIADSLVSKERPSLDDVSAMINLVSHIVNQETWRKYFTSKKSVNAFGEITSVKALQEEFARAQNQESTGTTSLEFVPTRGLLMEFSGHIADACWASKYENIAKKFPNFSTIVMVQNRGTKHERLAGASMVLETKSEDSEDLLIIRGLNPIENLINALQVKDFYEKFTDYVKGIAEKSGKKVGIVIDDHAGGSATNRPALYDFLEAKKEELENIKLASADDTTFNGYDIAGSVYLV